MSLAEMGRTLRTRRRALGLSRSTLAEAAGTRPVVLGRWERGETAPTPDQAAALAEALDLDPAVAAEWAYPTAPPREAEPATAPGARGGLAAWGARLRRRFPSRRRAPSSAAEAEVRPARWSLRAFGHPGRRTVLVAPPVALPTPSYLDDPTERRRYLLRWVGTIVLLGALAVFLVWALVELVGSWGAFLDLFRGHRPTGTSTHAFGVIWMLTGTSEVGR